MKIIRSAPRLTSVIVDIISLKIEVSRRNPENYINNPKRIDSRSGNLSNSRSIEGF